MEGYGASTYGDRIAARYDDWYPDADDAAIDLLAGLAGRLPVLELGIGTGRFALPLASRGVDIRGVDASPEMVEVLKSRPGGSDIPVTIADFGMELPEGPFGLVFVAFNTFFGLPDREAQERCLSLVAGSLSPGGVFLAELFVPDPARFDRDQCVRAIRVEADSAELEVSRHDPLAQVVTSQHIVISGRGIELYPVAVRYAWPTEVDGMAAAAGLALESRHEGWRGEPFTEASRKHVSIYRKPV